MAFAQNDENQQDQEQGALMTGGGQGSLNQGQGAAATPATAGIARQGSGRFTNLNKYVKANQQGSANLANRIGTGIQNQLTGQEQEVTGKVGQVTKEVGAGTEKVGAASKQKDALAGIADQFKAGAGFSVLGADRGAFGEAQSKLGQFTKDPGYQGFKAAQAGQAVDEQALGGLQEQAGQSANKYQNLFGQRQAQVGSSQGREQALSEFVGGSNQAIRPAYSSGQRQLDQLVLGQNKSNLQNLINKVGSNQANVQQALAGVGASGQAVQGLTKAEQDLISGIDTTGKSLQSNFYSAVDDPSKLAEVDTARRTEFEKASSDLAGGTVGASLYDQAQLGTLADQGIYTALDNADLGTLNRTANQFFKRKAGPNTYEDIASQQDVETDAAIAGILGGGATQRFKQAGDITTNADLIGGTAGNKSALLQAIEEEQARQWEKANTTGLGQVGQGGNTAFGQSVLNALQGYGADAIAGLGGVHGSPGKFKDSTNLGQMGAESAQTFKERADRNAAIRDQANADALEYNKTVDNTAYFNSGGRSGTYVPPKSTYNTADTIATAGHRYNQLKDYMAANKYGKNLVRGS